jgi:hypothetical protein
MGDQRCHLLIIANANTVHKAMNEEDQDDLIN